MLVLPSGVRFVIYILRLANLPRPTVPRKNTQMNYLLRLSTVGGVVVKESNSRSRVIWFKSQSRQHFLFYLFASFTSYQLPNLTTI